jgi:cbb3-type cytochrome oxidase subunit 1
VASEAGTTSEPRGSSTLAGLTTRLAFLVAGLFFVAGLVLFGLAAARLVWPELLDGQARFAYGRVFPAGVDALLFGWLTVAFLGYAFHAVPRLVGASLAFPLFALGALGLVAGGAGAGVALLLAGENVGGRFLEFPLFVDGALIAGYALAAGVLVLTARRGRVTGSRFPRGTWWRGRVAAACRSLWCDPWTRRPLRRGPVGVHRRCALRDVGGCGRSRSRLRGRGPHPR